MKEQQEAERLIELFYEQACQYNFTESSGWVLSEKETTKQAKVCAAICVKEIMKYVPFVDETITDTVEQFRAYKTSFVSYWEKVLSILEGQQVKTQSK